MNPAKRQTVVVHGRHAMKELRLRAAQDGQHGLQIMTFEQLAARLAGGFAKPIDGDSLRLAIKEALRDIDLGELDNIKSLPGMISASSETLQKAWLANINLKALAHSNPRIAALSHLEDKVLESLPSGMSRPNDLVEASLKRLKFAPAILGSVEIVGMTELSPCWRSLLIALKSVLPVCWNAGPRKTPNWLDHTDIEILRTTEQTPEIQVISAATAYHEAVEAMRWVRALLASGRAHPSEIAIAAASPADYDDYFITLRADANIDLHFAHGVRVVTTWHGQAAAALADIVVRGLSQSRFRRLVSLCKDGKCFKNLPEGWLKILPADAPLRSYETWVALIKRLKSENWPDKHDHSAALSDIIDLLAKGPEASGEIGEAFLSGQSLTIWRKALSAGPASSIDATLEKLKQDDGLESCASVTWMPASALAASPRKYVRLLGLNSSRWPRGIVEDRLIPDHIIPRGDLDPLPVNLADQRDFDTIRRTSANAVIMSLARRDSEGRLLGRSPILAGMPKETYLKSNTTPEHAFSETDRLMARRQEFASNPQALSARQCWIDWHIPEITPHDGIVRPDHPIILEILSRTQSASSLKQLLRNPLGFVWKYGFGWQDPESNDDLLVLEPSDLGDLVHTVLDHALRDLEKSGGLSNATDSAITHAAEEAVKKISREWEFERTIPPKLIWRRTLDDVATLAVNGLSYGDSRQEIERSYAEVPFGGAKSKTDGDIPWNPELRVAIGDGDFNISGYIDRLDIYAGGQKAAVRDYKTGKLPKDDVQLDGGKELQRCLYSFAVKSLLGANIEISASLYYPRVNVDRPLSDTESLLAEITKYLRLAKESLKKGVAVPGPDAGDKYDDLKIALPANAKAIYSTKKLPAVKNIMGEAAMIWEVK